jgi:hypothetical protein
MQSLHALVAAVALLLTIVPYQPALRAESPFDGSWELIPAKSTEIDLYGTLSLRFEVREADLTLVQRWGGRRSFTDSLILPTNGSPVRVPIVDRVVPSNVFMGLSMPVGQERTLRARWDEARTVLTVEEEFAMRGSQGLTSVHSVHRYRYLPGDELVEYSLERSTRSAGPGIHYVLKHQGSREAFVMHIEDNWEITGRLPVQALLLSLQGIANDGEPRLYFIYPPAWPFTYTESVYEFYREKRNYTFRELQTPQQALDALKEHVRGYVVWDTSVRTSLIVAFTVAGLERAIVVSEELIPLAEQAGLKKVEDFRGRFTGKSDAEIYQWAYDRYWPRCNKEFIVWLGGEHGNVMKPGVADWGVYKQVFFNDLSSRPSDTLEYALARRILGEMKPMSMVMGWHSYAKDLEREHVTLTSSFGHRVEGLHTLPNLSFSSQVVPTPGFQFRNNHTVVAGKEYVPGEKVYITCIQTDGIGIGAWLKPGRGEIPYAWEVLMNYTWMAPAMAEYFYTTATPNDYFLGCLSGPGYLYPKAVPRDTLRQLIALAREQMKRMDLRVFETMDYSEGATVEGNTDLTREVVDVYYEGMPEAIGFVNGYAPSYTFTVRDGRPFMSYDYYLSPSRPEADAVADLEELARVNARRPYFLLMHVRESSDVKRVKGILDKLGPQFELVPLDVFLTMAGKDPTFEERFLQR